jgi:hypothetical protein
MGCNTAIDLGRSQHPRLVDTDQLPLVSVGNLRLRHNRQPDLEDRPQEPDHTVRLRSAEPHDAQGYPDCSQSQG